MLKNKNIVSIENGVLNYFTSNPAIATDSSFILNFNDVYAIGLVAAVLDTDEHYIVFITKTKERKIIRIHMNICGFYDIIDYLKEHFYFDINKELSGGFYEDNKVLYPKHLYGKKIYCDDFKTKLKRALLIISPADGKLCAELF